MIAHTQWQDAVNAALEAAAIFAVASSIHKALKDRVFKGFSRFHMSYSFASATWFVYFYAHLSQPLSFVVACGYWLAVAIWAGIMIWLAPRGNT